MIKYIDPRKIIFSDEFVKQPVNEASNFLGESDARNLILYGARGSGKTTIMYNHQYKTSGTNSPAIFTRFDSIGMFGDDNKRFNEEFIAYYYELILTSKLLHYIERNYATLFEKSFVSDKTANNQLGDEIMQYINACAFKYPVMPKLMSIGTFTKNLIERFKNAARLQSITLMMDRFDWTDSRSAISQFMLKECFNLFDKSIITTDDEALISDENARKKMEDYSFYEVDYGRNLLVIKRIIQLRIANYNNNLPNGDKSFPAELSDEFYLRLIERTNGNISLALNVMNDLGTLWQWERGSKKEFDFMQNLDDCIDRQLDTAKELKRISRPTRLYLR